MFAYNQTGMNLNFDLEKDSCDDPLALDINASNFDCLTPRPECGAGASWVGLGEGAKPDAPLF